MSSLSSALGGFDGELVLDAFAGSGALGLEALSRGAARCVFVESDRSALAALRANIADLDVGDRATVMASDVFALANKGVLGGPFTLIMLDPPYTLVETRIGGLLQTLADTGSVSQGALVTVEHAAGTSVAWPEGYEPSTTKRYGSVEIDFAVYKEGETNR